MGISPYEVGDYMRGKIYENEPQITEPIDEIK